MKAALRCVGLRAAFMLSMGRSTRFSRVVSEPMDRPSARCSRYPKMPLSTKKVVPSIRRFVGRRQINHEQTMARFAKGTLARIKAVLGEREKQADFIREAVEAALERREASTPRKPKPSP
jgi:hypothetical protein